jgi:hypothetical protein
MEYNYKSINFLYVSDDVIRFYDKNKILRFTINRPLAYVYAQDSYIYIKHQNDNIIRLDFIDSGDVAIALDRLKPYLKNVNPEYYTSNEIDEMLTNYYTSEQTDQILDNYYTSEQTDQILDNYYTLEQTDQILDNYYTSGETDEILDNYYTSEQTDQILDNYYTSGETD